jgi:hypothetical protein
MHKAAGTSRAPDNVLQWWRDFACGTWRAERTLKWYLLFLNKNPNPFNNNHSSCGLHIPVLDHVSLRDITSLLPMLILAGIPRS